MRFEVSFDGLIRSVTEQGVQKDLIPPADQIKKFLNETMSFLSTTDAVLRADYSANPSEGEIDIVVSLDAEDELRSIELGSALIRSALHAAGGYTPGWKVDWCVTSRDEGAVLADAG